MDSRTKFYGPVLAMLSLSAVAFNGFITPSIESEESTSQSEQRQEEVLPVNQSAEPNSADSSESSSTAEGDPTADDGPSLTDESTADTPPRVRHPSRFAIYSHPRRAFSTTCRRVIIQPFPPAARTYTVMYQQDIA